MISHIIFWYIICSYVIGAILFMIELFTMITMRNKAIQLQGNTGIGMSKYININGVITMGVILLLLSPLTAWHGILHYAATIWAWLNNKPVKYWI